MTPESWQKLGDLVEHALSVEGEARQEFIDRACKGDPALKERVEQFINTYEQDKEFLEEPAIPGFSLENTLTPAQQIGEYNIIRPLGKGGMGEVFLAQREDGPVTHPVALKLIRAGKEYQDFTLSRFLVEQQILSELIHPNIARMLDAGTTDDGRPFFVMEYVDGLPITNYCDQHQLSINERLKLFLQVCNAVQFAHHNLIVHRDLKPSNLLVTKSGEVKLLDFGIAKALSPWQRGVSALSTETGFRVLTPLYASPEQVVGQPITTSSDVYSLGVLLYELLTGQRPYRLADLIELEMVRVILEEEPLPPSGIITQHFEKKKEDGSTQTITPDALSESRQTTKDRLQQKLRGELDHIVLMALRKEPTRRYNSALGLGEDIRRHLEGLPVEAQPDTIKYRMGKFVRRHKWGVLAAVAFVLLLTSFSIVTVVQSSRIRAQSALVVEERDRAQVEAAKSEKIVQILVELFETANPNRVPGGDTLRIAEFLKRGESKVLQGLEDEPELQAGMKHVLGRMYRAQGNVSRATELLEDALTQQRELSGDDDLSAIIMLRNLASVLYAKGYRDSSMVMYREVESRLRRSKEDVRAELATTLLGAAPRLSVGEYEEKERMLVEANTLIESLDAPQPRQRASVANQLGVYYYNQGLYKEAQAPFEKALHYLEQVVDSTDVHYLVTAGNLAGVLTNIGQFDEAERLHQMVLETRRSRKKNSIGVAFSLSQLGNLYYYKGDWQKAELHKAEAYDIVSSLSSARHPRTSGYGLSYATMLIKRRKFDKAEELIQEALLIRQHNFGEESVEVAMALLKRGDLLKKQGAWLDALSIVDKGLEMLYKHYQDRQTLSTASAEMVKGLILLELGEVPEACEAVQKTLLFRQEHESANAFFLAQAQVWAGVCLSRLGRHQEAVLLLEEGWPVFEHWVFTNEEDRISIMEALRQTREALK